MENLKIFQMYGKLKILLGGRKIEKCSIIMENYKMVQKDGKS